MSSNCELFEVLCPLISSGFPTPVISAVALASPCPIVFILFMTAITVTVFFTSAVVLATHIQNGGGTTGKERGTEQLLQHPFSLAAC